MTDQLAPTYPCPACGTTADLHQGCRGCGRGPDPAAAQVISLDHRLAELTSREQQWRQAHAAVLAELAQTRAQRDTLAAQVAASVAATAPAGSPTVAGPPAVAHQATAPPVPAPTPAPTPAPAPAPPAGDQDGPSRAVQVLLFVLGGLLLSVGAIVFTAVAWTRFGVAGRALVLAAVTVLVLAAPALARWRGLRGTAETFAALGILLLLLDGYAVWSVDLFGARGIPGSTWTAAVCAGVAVGAAAYGRLVRLTGPLLAATVLAQPVLPVLAVRWPLEPAGWAFLWVGLAAGNVLLAWWWRRGTVAGRVLAWLFTGMALAAGALVAILGLLLATTPGAAGLAGAALLAAVLVLAAVAPASRTAGWLVVAAAAAVPALVLVVARVGVLLWPGGSQVLVAATVALVVGLAAALARLRPGLRSGVTAGALVAIIPVVGYLLLLALGAALASVELAWLRQGTIGTTAFPVEEIGWQLLVALLLMAAALVTVLPRAWPVVAVAAVGPLMLAAPVAAELVWWAPAVAGLAGAAALGMVAVHARSTPVAVLAAVVAAALAGHGVLVGAATGSALAASLGAVVVIGVAMAVRAAGAEMPGEEEMAGGRHAGVRRRVGAAGLLVGLLAWPPAVAATVVAAGAGGGWPARAAMVAAVALAGVVLVVRRLAPVYLAIAAAAVHVATPVAVFAGVADRVAWLGAYAAAALLALAVVGLWRQPESRLAWLATRAPALVIVLAATLAPVAAVLFAPYAGLGRVWQGPPTSTAEIGGAPVALLLLAAAAAVAGRVLAGRWAVGAWAAVLVAPLGVLVGLAQAGAPWPVLPAVSLGLGAAGVLSGALRLPRGIAGVVTAYGVVLGGAGLAGALGNRWSTLAALGVAVAVAAVVGAAARARAARLTGWLAAVVFAVLLAIAAAQAAELPLFVAALLVLAVAAVALLASSLLGHRQQRTPAAGGTRESAALEAAAHATALVALLLALPGAGRGAAVAVLWAVALGLRAVWPSQSRAARLARAGASAGCALLAWWLLLLAQQVGMIEAYTVPAAAVAAAIGALVLRRRAEVGSLVALGPPLLAGFLPSVFLLLVDPDPVRRLLLGVVAVLVVVAGAHQRWKAPVIIGAVVAGLVALRELTLVWQLLDAWVPLTLAGLVLVTIAATYERRRRDLGRLRSALSHMR